MSKGSKRSRRDSATPVDVASSLLSPSVPRTVRNYQPENFYREVQDRRTWDPAPWKPAKTVSGGRPRIDVKRGPNGRPLKSFSSRAHIVGSVTSRLGFKVPHDILVCVRRAMRREVLFALRRNKKGAGAKRRRRNEYSDIDC